MPDGREATIYGKTKTAPLKSLILFEKNGHDVSDSIKFVNLVVPDLRKFLLEDYGLADHIGDNHILYQWEWGVDLTENYDRVEDIHMVLQTAAEEAFRATDTEKQKAACREI